MNDELMVQAENLRKLIRDAKRCANKRAEENKSPQIPDYAFQLGYLEAGIESIARNLEAIATK